MDAFTAGSTWAADRDALLTLPRRHVVLLAADWAEDVLHVYESACPGDDRPRRAVEAARWGGGRSAYAAANDGYAAYVAANAASAAAYAALAAADAANAANAVNAVNAAYAAVNAANAAANAAARAAYAAADAAARAAYAAYAANAAAAVGGWRRVHARWRAAWHGGRAFDPSWRTPLGRQLAADPEAYPVLLDHLSDLGAEVDDLRGLAWARSNWAVFHLTEGDVLSNRLPEEVCDGTA